MRLDDKALLQWAHIESVTPLRKGHQGKILSQEIELSQRAGGTVQHSQGLMP